MVMKSPTIKIDPSVIFYTHSKIRKRFTGCSKLIAETYDEIVSGATLITDIPLIRVIYSNDRYFSLNNRRLFLFKELQRAGKLMEVEVELRQPTSKSEIRLTTQTLSLNAKACLD